MPIQSRKLAVLLLLVCVASNLVAQKHRVPPPTDYLALIERSSANEIKALENPVPFEFTERLTWSWGSETRSVIETAEGRADRIVLFQDEPLQPDQQAKQQHRLEKLLRDRDAVKDEFQDQKAETQRRIKMIKAFPQAVLFQFAGHEKGLMRFTFRPNPEFSPKDRETQMYRGMEGSVWIEPEQERIVRVEGRLVKDVSFGWGFLGHLNKGGIYEIAQDEIVPGMWRITTLNVDVKGKIFLISGFRFFREEQDSNFRLTSASIHYRDAVESLLTTQVSPLAKDRGRSKTRAARSDLAHPATKNR
ncbi:MAG TPA: hypothetical protein VKH81_04605 [Candidatus Angelobacter sp.]|nr:hypothetical protein [Candidatus Angelobacter sp.]